MRTMVVDRFWSKVDTSGDCWAWTAAKTATGYGKFGLRGSWVLAHRWAYEAAVGHVPADLQLDHLCRNRACVRPSHLEPVTARENILRGQAPAARQAQQTHCKRGHSLPAPGKDGRRKCLECRRILSV